MLAVKSLNLLGRSNAQGKKEQTDLPQHLVPGVAEFLAAAKQNDVYEMSRLLDTHNASGLRPDVRDPMNRTALHEAATAGHLVACKFLLSRGAATSPKDSWNNTPLDDAMNNDAKDVQSLLVDAGATVGDAQVAAQKLFSAISGGDLARIEAIVSAGTPVTAVDGDNRSAMHHAAAKGDVKVMQYLIGAGAKLDIIDNFGLTPLGEADRHRSRTVLLQGSNT